jgi:phosphoribosylanthranilate isomerase
MIAVKLCGLNRPEDVAAAGAAGADWIGLVHAPRSPRHVSLSEAAALARLARQTTPCRVAVLLVDPSPALVAEVIAKVAPDAIQFHGWEPDSLLAAALAAGVPEVWKALPVAVADDLSAVADYPSASRFLFDAKPASGADRPGGWGHAFDWRLLAGLSLDRPWWLAGGLTPDNVAEAVAISGARGVDVSSGIEAAPGAKDPARIAAFVAAARSGG